MDNYREFVKNLANNKISKEFLNKDQNHALEVFENLFNMAKSEIRIFAASLCENENPDYVVNSPRYIIALSNFIERGGILTILLNHYDKIRAYRSNLMRRLAYYSISTEYKELIKVHSTDIKLHFTSDLAKNEVHFTVIDSLAYRIETNIEERAATCNFNNPSTAESLIKTFDTIFRDNSTELKLSELFENNY